MKKTGAALAVYALEQLPIRYTFGIPGVHNTELYDELGKSKKIRPILVTHGCFAFLRSLAASRICDSFGVKVVMAGSFCPL